MPLKRFHQGRQAPSSSYYYNPPSMAFDSNPSTYWRSESEYSYGTFTPVWWEIEWPSPQFIHRVEIQWGSYAGKDFEIQGWSGNAWISWAKLTGNTIAENIFDFDPSYRTDKIRIYITRCHNFLRLSLCDDIGDQNPESQSAYPDFV